MMSPSTPHKRECLELFDKLSAYIDNELDSNDCRSIEQHLLNCDACQSCLGALKRTIALCRGTATTVPVPEKVSQRLKALVKQLQGS